ncbi:4'-phosphopantetheinyl transferase [Sphaerimonospora cavernae]|uniref:4'-phosphopantetheinyl transferase n=1 Tax=Sphaerimonospora cavernae TaxID=1740611 RepID=A0ABV6UCC2_9ACTN
MMEKIVGPDVVAVDTRSELTGVVLFPQERAEVADAVAKRREEYTTARACARQAMEKLGLPPSPITRGPRGEPIWPEGVIGSITHCSGYRAAVLGWAGEVTTLGIDAEPNDPLPEGVLETISLPAERAWIRRLSATRPGVAWDRLLFSAKESVYKAWYPLARRWLDFSEAMISLDPSDGRFLARLLVPGPEVEGERLTEFSGRWLAEDGLVLTAIVVPSRESNVVR